MRHIYNEDLSPETPEAKDDFFQCLSVCANQKFSLANLLPSRLVLTSKMCVYLWARSSNVMWLRGMAFCLFTFLTLFSASLSSSALSFSPSCAYSCGPVVFLCALVCSVLRVNYAILSSVSREFFKFKAGLHSRDIGQNTFKPACNKIHDIQLYLFFVSVYHL